MGDRECGNQRHCAVVLCYNSALVVACICREMVVYREGDNIYHSKMLTFYRKEPFQLVASYSQPDQVPYSHPQIGKVWPDQVPYSHPQIGMVWSAQVTYSHPQIGKVWPDHPFTRCNS